MGKSNSVGTVLKVNTKTVGGLKTINGIDVTADKIDVTALDTTGGYREFLPGFKQAGDVSCSGFFDGNDVGQTELYSLLASGNVVTCSIVFPATIGKTWTFSASVVKFTTSVDLEDAIRFEVGLAVSGAPTLADTPTNDVSAAG